MTPVSLHCLPAIPRNVVFKCMDLSEQFMLSTLSIKTRNMVERCLARKTYLLELEVPNPDNFTLNVRKQDKNKERRGIEEDSEDEDYEEEEDTCELQLKLRKLKEADLEKNNQIFEIWRIFKNTSGFLNGTQSPTGKEIIESYWKNPLETVKRLIEEFRDIFNNPIISLNFGKESNDCVLELIRHIKSLNLLKIDTVFIQSDIEKDKLNEEVLDECREVSNLHFYCRATDDFLYDPKSHQPFQFDVLCIEQGSWVTMDHVIKLFMNCRIFDLCGGDFEYFDMPKFLKSWIQGSMLEYASWTYDDLLMEAVPDDFPCKMVMKAIFKDRTRHFGVGKCFLIENTNGKEAVIYKFQGRFILTTDFIAEKVVDIYDEDSVLPEASESSCSSDSSGW